MSSNSALSKTHLLILNQVVSRLFTFGLNILVLRYTGADVFGLFAVNLYLIYTIILFLCREPFRRATLQAGYVYEVNILRPARDAVLASTVTTTWLVIPLACAIAIAVVLLSPPSPDALSLGSRLAPALYPLSAHVSQTITQFSVSSWISHVASSLTTPSSLLSYSPAHTYLLCSIIIAVSAILELTAEPAHLYATRAGHIGLRVLVESAANGVRCVATYVFCVWMRGGLLGFAVGQLVGSAAWPLVYYVGLHRAIGIERKMRNQDKNAKHESIGQCPPIESVSKLLPSMVPLDRRLLSLVGPFFAQSIEKLLLTEGEKMVLVVAAPLTPQAQGAYAVVQNLASLVLRVVFQPLEEAAALAFGESVRAITLADQRAESSKEVMDNKKDDVKAKEITATAPVLRLRHTVVALLRVVLTLSLLIAAFGPHYSLSLFAMLYGNAWTATEAPAALAAYCGCLVCLAANGIAEAAMYACVSASDLAKASRALLLFSLAYLLCCWGATAMGLGMLGLLAANAVSMALRAWYALRFLSEYIMQRGRSGISWAEVFPNTSTVSAFVVVSVVAAISQFIFLSSVCEGSLNDAGCAFARSMKTWMHHGMHIGVGVVLLGAVLLVFRRSSWYVVQDFKELIRNNKKDD